MTTADFLIQDPFSRFSGEDKLKAHPEKFQKRRVLPSADMSFKRQNHKPKWQLQAVPHAIRSDVVTSLMAAEKAKNRDLANRKMLYYWNNTFKAKKDQFYDGTNKVMKVIAEESQKKVHEEFYNTKIELVKKKRQMMILVCGIWQARHVARCMHIFLPWLMNVRNGEWTPTRHAVTLLKNVIKHSHKSS